MLQFSATLCTATARLTPRSSWRLTALIASNSSTVATNEQTAASAKEDNGAKFTEIQKNIPQKEEQQNLDKKTKFDVSGKHIISENDMFVKQFQAARSTSDLLDLAMVPNLSANNALKLISSITNRINSGKSQTVNIEADQRFVHLRKIVRSSDRMKTDMGTTSDDLSKYSQLSTPAMISVIATLREQGKRNTPLLRMLSYNIVKYNVKLNLKQCATLLYSMAVLNFPEKVLLEKIMSDLLDCIPNSTNAATNKSIITSLGFLHYKNEDVLDAFCDTLFAKSMKYKYQDYSSILQTFAVLQYKSERTYSFIENFAVEANPFLTSANEWLDIVWSLALLDAARPRHVESVLEPAFMERLTVCSDLSVSRKLKLLNINAVAQLILKDYKGSLLNRDTEAFNNVCLVRTKAKQVYLDALSETLQKLYPSQPYFKTDIDTNMGFLLDAEYHINDQCKPILVQDWDERNTSENVRRYRDINTDSAIMNCFRIAIMVHDYHDYCRGQNDPIGSTYLSTQLLRAKGYNLVTISHENFSIQDKIEKRINYLKQCLKSVQEKRTI